MPLRSTVAIAVVVVGQLVLAASQQPSAEPALERQFSDTVRPFFDAYCISCHGGAAPAGHLDLRAASSVAVAVQDYDRWSRLVEKLSANEMPPNTARQQPPLEARQQAIDVITAVLRNEARKNAGDPGIVLARRLSNAEYNYTVRDLTGVDIRPAREFPVDPANPAGFDNSGESLAMSPALLTKYLQAAKDVANHLVLKPHAIAFAPHPMLVETDRDKYCVNQIIDFYQSYSTDYAVYFETAWRYKHRAALGQPKATLAELAGGQKLKLSPKYLATIWRTLEETKEEVGPIARLQAMWRSLGPPKDGGQAAIDARARQMRDFVVDLRKKITPKVTNISMKGISATAQPFLMWRNRQYAANRRTFDPGALQPEGETTDPELLAPAADRARYEAAFARFSAVFPDAFFVSERGRYFPDNTRDTGRHLSAGFHNVMGYFRDDRPFYDLMLEAREQKQLDAMWQDLDFVASANIRTYIQFYLNESGEARGLGKESEGPRPADTDIISESLIKQIEEAYLGKARAANNESAIKAIEEHFRDANAGIRWVEQARREAEPRHLEALQDFAARAYRRPLTRSERDGLVAYYRSLREKAGLDHEEAMRDSVVSILMSPDFCYLPILADTPERAAARQADDRTRPLSDYTLASRLSYFLWSSMPDAELLARAAAGDLHRPEVLTTQARRMLKDERVRGLATEFGGNWLDFRRFEEHNAVDRERFSTFTNDLREAMFEEPIRFMMDVFRNDRPVLDVLYANHTFVNPVLARHYGMPDVPGDATTWIRVDGANRYERGGVLPMSVFLTKNAPGLRTSPVKRGYWFVKQMLGERIPPPPAAVPELPRDEAKMDVPLRDMLARHRQDKSCASCHARFDSFGLAFEGYGPVGERRTTDLAGRPVDASATFPGGSTGTGTAGLRAYVREHRQNDFVDNVSRKLLAFALGRSVMLSDDPTIEDMRATLARNGYRFSSLVESVVTSKQFLTRRGGNVPAANR